MQFLTFYLFFLAFIASALPTKQNRTKIDVKKSDVHEKRTEKRHATMLDPEEVLFDWFLNGESYYHPGEHSRIPHQEIMSVHVKRGNELRFKDLTAKNAWDWAKMNNIGLKDILGYKKKRNFSLGD